MTKASALEMLCKAASCGDIDAATEALAQGARINGRMEYGMTPVMMAIANADIPMIRLLKSEGARLNLLDEDNEHPLTYIFGAETSTRKDGSEVDITPEQKVAVLKALISMGANPNARGDLSIPALYQAAWYFNAAQVHELIGLGMDVRQEAGVFNQNFIHAIALSNTIAESEASSLIDLAIRAGVDINAKTHAGETALDYATQAGRSQLAEVLVAAGASVNTSVAPSPRRRAGPR